MERGMTPCTALTFVRNGGASFKKCLESALFCAEHVVLDGGSDDGTRELAELYGCRVISQDKAHLHDTGRIIDYAGITNQGIAAASHPWVMIVSADEEIEPLLIDNMRRAIEQNDRAVYDFERLYVVGGRVIRHASTYPSRQIRLFRKDAIDGFVKPVHERPAIKPGVPRHVLDGIQLVPFDPPAVLARKHNRYIALEIRNALPVITWSWWLRIAWNKLLRVAYRVLRVIGIKIMHPRTSLPLRYEWLDIRYPLLLTWRSMPLWAERNARII